MDIIDSFFEKYELKQIATVAIIVSTIGLFVIAGLIYLVWQQGQANMERIKADELQKQQNKQTSTLDEKIFDDLSKKLEGNFK